MEGKSSTGLGTRQWLFKVQAPAFTAGVVWTCDVLVGLSVKWESEIIVKMQ